MSKTAFDLEVFPDLFAICRLDAADPVPRWAFGGRLASVTATDDELSVVCPEPNVPDRVRASRGWRCLRVAGPLDFSLVGVLADLTRALADAKVPVFALSTFDTDLLLVRAPDLDRAEAALRSAGHSTRPSSAVPD
jgi:hypothetical protein